MNTILIAFMGAILLASPLMGYETGAPVDACKDMIPQHHTPPQTDDAPYTIKATPSEVHGGETVEVVISGNEAKDTIKGFLLQARHGDTPVGSFKVAPGDKFAQTLKCDNEADSVTHRKHDAKDDKRSITFTWVAPKHLKGEIKFRATVALNGGVFWVGIQSNPVLVQ